MKQVNPQWKSLPDNNMNITTLPDVNMLMNRNVTPLVDINKINIDRGPIHRRDLNKLRVCGDLRPKVIARPTLLPVQRLNPFHYEEEPQITALQVHSLMTAEGIHYV